MAGSDLSRLLKKGLTGWEVGILTIKDSIGVWQARKPAFTKAEYGQMKTSLRTAKDISDYNKLVNVLGVVEESHYVANIAELSALVDLGSLDDLTGYGLTRALFEMHLARIPKIVTQKQLEDLREAEREGVLGMTWTARELVEERAISLTKKAIPDYKYDIGA